MAEELESQKTTPRELKAGTKTFGWTLFLLIVLIVAYVISHIITLDSYGYIHYEAADVAGARQDLLVSVAILEEQLDTPTATASPAVKALLHDLQQSVVLAESQDEISNLFGQATKSLSELGIHQDISLKILEPAKNKANELVSASDEERDAAQQRFQIELELAQAWALDALGAPNSLVRVAQLEKAADGLGYGADSKVGKTLTDISTELKADRPNRRLTARMLTQVAEELRGRQSPFWSHPVLRWIEVMAWSLAGMLLVRLWSIGKFLGSEKYDPKWNWWWWARIVQAPLLAVGVVLALTYFELGIGSGETFALRVGLNDQPMGFVVAISFLLGLFSHRAYDFLVGVAESIMPDEQNDNDGQHGS